MPEKIDFNKNKLIQLFANMPRGYGDGPMMNDKDARRIADKVVNNFFVVDLDEVPDYYIDRDTLTARECDEQVFVSYNITADDDIDHRYSNILAHISNYLALEEIQTLLEEKQKVENADAALAFTLLKVADPYNLRYVNWGQVPRVTQDVFLTIARKARQELVAE